MEMLLEKFDAFAAEVGGFPGSVTGARNHIKGELLVGFDEIVDDLVGRRGVDVFVQLTDRQHEVALKLGNVSAVGVFDIGFVDGPIEPLLVPPHFINTVVMAATIGDRSLIKVSMVEEGGG